MTVDSIWQTAKAALDLCLSQGVQEFVVCAGARNGPLVEILFKHPELKTYNFFDERAAGFFAIGRMRASERPVAVVTTSGTAAAELYPAVIESFHQGLPLIALTADRPRRFRGTGSPQTMNQERLFGDYSDFVELESGREGAGVDARTRHKPLQINCCLEEPSAELMVPSGIKLSAQRQGSDDRMLAGFTLSSVAVQGSPTAKILKDPLVIVGPLKRQHREAVAGFLNKICKGPTPAIYCESLSGLSHLSTLSAPEAAFKSCASILRLGAVPTHRLWRDLESNSLRVVSVVPPEEAWPGLARESELKIGWESLESLKVETPSDDFQAVINSRSVLRSNFKSTVPSEIPPTRSSQGGFEAMPEALFLANLAPHLKSSRVYVGNSLPVRHWDRASQGLRFLDVCGNRGVNGIDGQISSYLGWTATTPEESWCIVGDLTALYDLNALWVTSQIASGPRRILVINNGGGQIFQKFSRHPQFLNAHSVGFEGWAQQWGWSYQRWTGVQLPNNQLPAQVIIEWRPQ